MQAPQAEAIADIGSDQADLDPASARYAQRFAGKTGAWLLSRQSDALLSLTADLGPGRVLDVGGGHGQVAPLLAARGHDVTVHASSEAAIGTALLDGPAGVSFSYGSLRALPFDDASFDLVTSFRIMAHIGDWEHYLSELARVSRQAVVIDFPIPGGANALEPLLFGLKKKIEGNTRRYATMGRGAVQDCLAQAGFGHCRHVGQFVLPMVLHRKLKAPGLSGALEAGGTALGLAGRIGSPVVLRADRMRAGG